MKKRKLKMTALLVLMMFASSIFTANAQTNYGIKIAGTDLTSANAGAINNDNFPGLGLTKGTITYNHSAKTITLNGVNVNVTNYKYFIEISASAIDEEYKIKLVNNNIVTTNPSSIFTKKSLTIEGSGSLKATSVYAAIELYSGNLTLKIKNTTVEAIGKWGIAGNNGRGGETLIIENSTVKATGGSGGGSIMDFQTITLNGCTITQPADAKIAENGTNGMAVMQGSTVVTSQVIIEPTSTAPPAGTPVIKLTTTTEGATVRLSMRAATADTPAWIETAPGTYIPITVGTGWTSYTNYTPTGTSLKVYGAIIAFNSDGSPFNPSPVSAIDASGNTGLQELYCPFSQLQSLDVSGLTQLQTLKCFINQLTSLDISGLTQLQVLYCYGNQLQSLDVSGLTQLQVLDCHGNQLTSLTVSELTQLQRLICCNNQLTSLNVSGLVQLNYLHCSDNQLPSLNVSGLTQLKELYCFGNPCTSTTFGLDQIYCQLPERQQSDDARIYVSGQAQAAVEAFVRATNGNNASGKHWKLYGYDLATGSDYQITNATGNYVCGNPPNLPVIKLTTTTAGASVRMRMVAAAANTLVWIQTGPNDYTRITVGTNWTDYISYAPTSGTSLKVYGAITGFDCSGESDTNTNPVSVLDASGNTGLQQLHCYKNQLQSLDVSGLTQLQALYCDNNRLTNLDVSGLTQLKSLLCYKNQLQSLNVSGLTQLQYLSCSDNQLQSLDVSGLTQLQGLYCENNQLQSLNVQGLTQLQGLDCYKNKLQSLDVSGLTQLQLLQCFNNRLQSLDVSGLTQLQYLFCHNNQLKSLNVSGLTQLKELYCSDNQLMSLNISGLTQLKVLYCYNNQLQSLDVSGLTQLQYLVCFGNPYTSTTFGLDQIYCQLPERQQSDDAGIYVSGQAQAAVEAFVRATNGDNASNKHWNLYGYDFAAGTVYKITNATGNYVCGNPPNLPVITLTTTTAGASVRMRMGAATADTPVWIQTGPNDYTPITVGTNWTDYISYAPTSGTSLKVYGAVTYFDCSGESDTNTNPVSVLDASGNTGLQYMSCFNNRLTNLDVSGLTQLEALYCDNNQLQNLNVSGLTQLQELDCYNNRLTSLDVLGSTQLQLLHCYNNQLQNLDVSGLNQLYELYCYNNQLTSLDVSELTQLQGLNCYNNQLTSLNVSDLTQLKTLYCFGNPCTSTTSGLDQIYCQLPARQQSDNARIYVSGQAQAGLETFVLTTNGDNASDKYWKLYAYDLATNTAYQITNTAGNYVCGIGTSVELVESSMAIYPNPASNTITIETGAIGTTITITDLAGHTVMTATATDSKTTLNVSELSAGTYIVRVGERVAKVVKAL